MADSVKNVFSDLNMRCMSGIPVARYWSQGAHGYSRFEVFSKLRSQFKGGIPYRDALVDYSAAEFSRIAQQLLVVFQ